MNWAAVGAVFMALAVALGAFGAHALRERFGPYETGIWEKAVFYHFVHAAGVLIVAVLAKTEALSAPGAARVSMLLIAGILLFSGSLYALALSGVRTLGAVTPLGGTAFILAWLLLAFELTRRSA